jgi:hypothetical protein
MTWPAPHDLRRRRLRQPDRGAAPASTSSSPAPAAWKTSCSRATAARRIEITVLDEADHMADMGFLPVVKRIMDKHAPRPGSACCSAPRSTTASTSWSTATCTTRSLHSGRPGRFAVAAMTHHVFETALGDKLGVVTRLAAGTDRSAAVHPHQARREEARQAARPVGHPAVELHGNLSQNARDRNLADFSGPGEGARRHRHRRPRHPRRRRRASSCTSTRRPSTRRTCTARAAPPAPAPSESRPAPGSGAAVQPGAARRSGAAREPGPATGPAIGAAHGRGSGTAAREAVDLGSAPGYPPPHPGSGAAICLIRLLGA